MIRVSASDLKAKGVAAIEPALAEQSEALVSVRGKGRFVVMDLAHYHYLRECELDAALAETRADLAAGRFVEESADAHKDRLEAELAAEAPGTPHLMRRREAVSQAAPRRSHRLRHSSELE